MASKLKFDKSIKLFGNECMCVRNSMHTTTGQVKWALHLFSNNIKYSGLHGYYFFAFAL